MSLRYLFFYFIIYNLAYAKEKKMQIVTSNHLNENEESIKFIEQDLNISPGKTNAAEQEKVTIQFYYECLCPYCIEFVTNTFTPVVQKLGQYLNIQTYPYGNAQTFEHNGQYEFKCQHGPEECYGNKLHACAIDLLRNMSRAVFFNSCMMKQSQGRHGSDDNAADACGKVQGVDAASIKECAKGNKGTQLLKHYGDESKKAHFNYVPYVLINGTVNDGDNFMNDVCSSFINPPPPCKTYQNTNKENYY